MNCTVFVYTLTHPQALTNKGGEMKLNSIFDFRGAAMLACIVVLFSSCTSRNSHPQPTAQNRVLTAPTGASVSAEPEDGQWTMPAKNYAHCRQQHDVGDNALSNDVTVIDTSTNKVIATVKAGDGPWGIAL